MSEKPKILKVKEWVEKQKTEAFLKEINQYFSKSFLDRVYEREEKYHKAYLKMMKTYYR